MTDRPRCPTRNRLIPKPRPSKHERLARKTQAVIERNLRQQMPKATKYKE